VKNTTTTEVQLTQTNITFCYGAKSYKKYMKKEHLLDNKLESNGVMQGLIKDNGNFSIVIATQMIEDIYTLKSILVHEISHAVTEWMDHFGFDCDEVRSYTLQMLYLEFMIFLDNQLKKNND
jgi:hypothetical protein